MCCVDAEKSQVCSFALQTLLSSVAGTEIYGEPSMLYHSFGPFAVVVSIAYSLSSTDREKLRGPSMYELTPS